MNAQMPSKEEDERHRRIALLNREMRCRVCGKVMTPLVFDGTQEIGWACATVHDLRVEPRMSYASTRG
jgi:hypothetical protein